MERFVIYLVISIVMFIYGSINYYIGIRGWQALGSFIPILNRQAYWVVFWLLVISFFIGRLGSKFLPALNTAPFAIIGSYWLASLFYLILIVVFLDIIRLLNKWLNIMPPGIAENPTTPLYMGLIVFSLIIGIMVYGSWNARNVQIVRYDIAINKSTPKLSQLHVAMVSDIHLGTIMDNKRLVSMVDKVNELNPDVIFLVGDIVDEDINPFIEQKMAETLKNLKSRFGTFAVLGNHEYIGGHVEEIMHYLAKGNVQILRDNKVKLVDSIYIVGRDDYTNQHFKGGKERQPLKALLADIDKELPIIVLDHQPRAIEEAQREGVDLQFSGHTHRGQLFPSNLITEKIFEIDWGYLKKGDLQVIVTSGFGTWGPPIRIGSNSEIVEVFVNFQ